MKKLFIISIALFASFSKAFCQDFTEDLTEKFFKAFETDPIKAYENAFKNNSWVSSSDLETVKIKLRKDLDQLGKYQGFEEIAVKYAGKCYLYKVFFAKFDKLAMRISFLLYKPQNEWRVQNLSYDFGISDELEEAAKIYRLKENYN